MSMGVLLPFLGLMARDRLKQQVPEQTNPARSFRGRTGYLSEDDDGGESVGAATGVGADS